MNNAVCISFVGHASDRSYRPSCGLSILTTGWPQESSLQQVAIKERLQSLSGDIPHIKARDLASAAMGNTIGEDAELQSGDRVPQFVK